MADPVPGPDLEAALVALTRRVDALERLEVPATRTITGLELVSALTEELPNRDAGEGLVTYAGAGSTGDGFVTFQINRTWNEPLRADPASIAGVVSAIGSPVRVEILQRLLLGAATKSELSASLDEPTAGQMYHHLKELLAVGLVHQPRRGVYAVAVDKVVPLLALMSTSLDLADSTTSTGSIATAEAETA